MTTPMYAAIHTVVKLVTVCKMSMRDAIRAAAHQHGISHDRLYRELTR